MREAYKDTFYIRDTKTGSFIPVPAIVGEKGPAGGPMWIVYSNNADGTDFSTTVGGKYIGIATGREAPTDKTGYTWSQLTGDTGSTGATGANGDSIYLAYSKESDGTDYSTTWSYDAGHVYIGIATGIEAPTDKTGYTWARFIGDTPQLTHDLNGNRGDLGISQAGLKNIISNSISNSDNTIPTCGAVYRANNNVMNAINDIISDNMEFVENPDNTQGGQYKPDPNKVFSQEYVYGELDSLSRRITSTSNDIYNRLISIESRISDLEKKHQ